MIFKTLLIQFGDIGDLVWMLPAIKAVKSAYADSKVSVLLKKPFSGILEDNPDIDRLFLVPQSSGYQGLHESLTLIRDIRAHGFDQVIDFRSGDRGAIMSLLSCAPERVAMLYRTGVPFWRNWMYNRLVDPVNERKRGAAKQTLKILKEIGIEPVDEKPEIQVRESKRAIILKLLKDSGINESDEWVSINPFSRWSYKEIHMDKWIEVIKWLWTEYSFKSILVGSADEWKKSAQIVNKTGDFCYNLAGSTKLGDLPALLSFSKIHIGVDSAAPHIAAAVGTPTITIYGPSDWFEWAPLGDLHQVILPEVDCSPCRNKGCDNSGLSKCLEELSVERIKAAIRNKIT